MRVRIVSTILLCSFAASAGAQDLSWRSDIQPLIAAKCGGCHGAKQPEFGDWMVQREKNKSLAPRMDTYAHFMNYVIWPATGAMMRRLDDGTGSTSGKPGNMYQFLGADDAERAGNLRKIKNWLGEGAWNLNRWSKQGDTPGITKEQLDRIKARY
jgi:single heme cytochrome PccH